VAEEILQEALFKAFVALSGFRGEASFATWLSHIARNSYAAWRKTQRLRPDQEMLDEHTAVAADQLTAWPTHAESPETLVWQQELQTALGAAMADLPEAWRQALTLREEEGLSYETIAQIQKVPLGTVRSRIHRARESLVKTLHHLMEPA